jgi:hypothetical protein
MEKARRKESDEDIIRQITEYKEDYLALDKDRLALFAVGFLEARRIEPTFDKIVATAFRLFPKKFSLIGFPEYPDGRTIYYCVYNHCTLTKKWLSGNIQSGFKITDRGKYFLDETKKMLEGKIKVTRKYSTVAKRKELTFLKLLKKTEAYKKFKSGKQERITQPEILDALKTQYNSKDLVEKHLKKYLEYARRINDLDAKRFLHFLKRRISDEHA